MNARNPGYLHVVFQDAFNRHDLDAIVALYEPGAVLVTVDGPVHGAAAIREAYRGFFASSPIMVLQTLGVTTAGDLAMLHGKWTLRRTGPDGGLVATEGRNTEVVRLQPDDRWLFVIDNPGAA